MMIEPFFSVSSIDDVSVQRPFAADFPIPAGFGEIAVGEVGVPDALLMVAVEPVVGVAGRRFVVLADGFGECRFAFGVGGGTGWRRRAWVSHRGEVRPAYRAFRRRIFAGFGFVLPGRLFGRLFLFRFEQCFQLPFAMSAGQADLDVDFFAVAAVRERNAPTAWDTFPARF